MNVSITLSYVGLRKGEFFTYDSHKQQDEEHTFQYYCKDADFVSQSFVYAADEQGQFLSVQPF